MTGFANAVYFDDDDNKDELIGDRNWCNSWKFSDRWKYYLHDRMDLDYSITCYVM